jgi:hypothetical protein
MADKDKQKEIAKYLNDPKRAVILSKKGIDPKMLKKLADKYSGSKKKDYKVPLAMASLWDKWEKFNLRPGVWKGRPATYQEWLEKNHPKRVREGLRQRDEADEEKKNKDEKKDKKDDDDDDEPPPRSMKEVYQENRERGRVKVGDQSEFDLFEALALAAGAEGARRLWKKLPKKKIASFLARSAVRHRTAIPAGMAGQLIAVTADAAEMMPSKKAEAAARKKDALEQKRRLDKKARRAEREGAVGLSESPSGSRTTDEDEGDE